MLPELIITLAAAMPKEFIIKKLAQISQDCVNDPDNEKLQEELDAINQMYLLKKASDKKGGPDELIKKANQFIDREKLFNPGKN